MELFRTFSVPYNVYAGGEGHYAMNYDEIIGEVRGEAREYLEKKSNELRNFGVKNVSCIVKEGLAGDEIIAMSRNTPGSLIAMCSHGRSGMSRWVLGSVAETVVRHSAGPVLITRPS
jgi:nucleotide-binding universal stress UspA family protein